MKEPKVKSQFCKNGHDTLVTGRDGEGRCVICRKDWCTKRAKEILSGERVVKNIKQFCPKNHDTFICGRDKQGKCRLCSNIFSEQWNLEHSEEKAEYSAKYRVIHKEEIKTKQKEWRYEHKDIVRGYNLKQKYNITSEQYNQFFKNQNELCLGCSRHRSEFDKDFAVDHDHSCCPGEKSCGKCIRGLLCDNCNRILGQAKDLSSTLRRLADYLDSHIKQLLSTPL